MLVGTLKVMSGTSQGEPYSSVCLLPGQGLAKGECSLTVAWEFHGLGESLDSLQGFLTLFLCHGLLWSLGKTIFKRHLKIHRVTNYIETVIKIV